MASRALFKGSTLSESPATAGHAESRQRVGPLVVIPSLLREMQVDPAEVLAGLGLDGAALDEMENRIPYIATGRLLNECAARTGCPHFGLLVGQRTRLAHLGLPGRLLQHSPSLGAGLRTLVVYQHINSQGLVDYLSERGGMASFGSAVYQTGTAFVDLVYDATIAIACSVLREVCGIRWAPELVIFSRARPADVGPYRRFFQAPCRFDSEKTALLFPTSLLTLPMPEADSKRLRALEEQAQEVGIDLVSRLRRVLRSLLLDGNCSADKVAQILSMHRRTLNRRLKALGTSFQKVLDEVRFQATCELVDATRLPLTDIALSAGYSESSAFSRAFRRWSQAAPSVRRQMNDPRRGRPPNHPA
jgi:AraC-like DNA-binding protein